MVTVSRIFQTLSAVLLFSLFLFLNSSVQAVLDEDNTDNEEWRTFAGMAPALHGLVLDYLSGAEVVRFVERFDSKKTVKSHIHALDFTDDSDESIKSLSDNLLQEFTGLRVFNWPRFVQHQLELTQAITDNVFAGRAMFRILQLWGDQFTDAAVAGMEDLMSLSLVGKGFTDASLAQLTNLTSLDLHSVQLTHEAFAGLMNLRDLSVAYCDGITSFVKLTNLTSLCVCDFKGNDAALVGLENLTSLSLYYCDNLTDGVLANKPQLRSLALAGGRFTDQAIAGRKLLTSLKLLGDQFTHKALGGLQSLASVELYGKQFTKAAADGKRHLVHFKLNGQTIIDKGQQKEQDQPKLEAPK